MHPVFFLKKISPSVVSSFLSTIVSSICHFFFTFATILLTNNILFLEIRLLFPLILGMDNPFNFHISINKIIIGKTIES